MKRQVTNSVIEQAQYPARRFGFLPKTIAGIISIVCLSVVACQPLEVPAEGSGSETTLPATASAQEANQEDEAMVELSGPEQILVDLAKTDLSAELGVGPDEINVSSVQAIDFADASLGCPEEGMMYAQVITSGYTVMLEVDDTVYEYHGTTQGDGRVVRCQNQE